MVSKAKSLMDLLDVDEQVEFGSLMHLQALAVFPRLLYSVQYLEA